MFSSFKKAISVGLMMAGVLAMPLCARADSSGGHYADNGYHPTNDGGNFGIGLEFGEPGTWGAAGKIWVDRVNAFAPAVKFETGGTAILQLDYLWHNFDIFHMDETSGEMPFYIGLGGNLLMENIVEFAGRLPVGLSYIFDKRNVPIDIYLQAVPTLWFPTGGTTFFDIYGEVGAHYYF